MARGKEYNYFDMFVKMTEHAGAAAKILESCLRRYDAARLPETMEAMHAIEHAADLEKHEMMRKLAREFLSPIEREDIVMLSQALDTVVDRIEDVLLRMYMFNVRRIRDEALAFSDVICKCCSELTVMMREFRSFRKSNTIHQHIIEINRLEEEGDKLFTDAMHAMYVNCPDPVELVSWTDLYHYFERCCDACEDVADIVESVIMNNT